MSRINKVLVTFPRDFYYDDSDKANFQRAFPAGEFIFCDAGEVTPSLLEQIDVWMGFPSFSQLEKAKNLKWLQLFSAGADYYCSKADKLPKNIILTNASGAYGLTISEYMLATLIMMMRILHLYRDQQLQNHWEQLGAVDSIYGSRILVVGLGDIGSAFAQKTKALGAYNVGIKRTQAQKPDYVDELYTMESLDAQLAEADVVALSLPSTAETRNLMDAQRLKRIKKGAYLLNVGRGDAVDCDALTVLLREGYLKGASLDVTNPEPLPENHPLWDEPNAVITPHCSGNYTLDKTVDNIKSIFIDNLRRYGAGEPLANIVDTKLGYRIK